MVIKYSCHVLKVWNMGCCINMEYIGLQHYKKTDLHTRCFLVII